MSLRSIVQKMPKRVYAALAIAVAVVAVPAGLLAWGPGRETFTVAHPAPYVTFNSITDNPNIGDERNFVGIRENGTNGLWRDSQNVTPGKEYVVRLYVHNNAAENLKLVAQNVKASVNLPTNTAKSIEVQGFINSSNAKPTEVYDHATFTSNQNFNLAYVPGTLKYYNNANGKGFTIPESVFTNSGASLGYDKMDGKIPGCFQYAGYLTFIVKPQFATPPTFTAEKLVSKHGENKWVNNYVAQPGETVDYLLEYKNTSKAQQDSVTFRDTLPANVSYVTGSTIYGNSKFPSGTKASDNVTTTGINVGSYAAGANAWAIFSAKVADKDKLPCGKSELVNKVNVTTAQGGSKDDTATVTVNKTCEVKKVPACNLKTKKIEQVEESKIDSVNYTLDLEKCKEVEKVTACNLKTKQIEQNVDKTKIDNINYTLDLDKCKPEDKDIQVCRLSDKKYPVTIKESQFDSTKYSKNPEDCKAEEKTIKVCRLSDKKYPVTIKESEFDSSKYSKNPDDCKPAEKTIEVCRLSDKKYPVTIKESEFDSSKYSKDPKDCKTPEDKDIQVCRLSDKVYPVTIKESQFDSTKYSKDPNDCKAEEKTIKVCRLSDKEYPVTIKESEFDSSKYSKDASDCDETPMCEIPGKENLPADSKDCVKEETPEELPRTGMSEGILSVLGLGSLVSATGAYIASRRTLNK